MDTQYLVDVLTIRPILLGINYIVVVGDYCNCVRRGRGKAVDGREFEHPLHGWKPQYVLSLSRSRWLQTISQWPDASPISSVQCCAGLVRIMVCPQSCFQLMISSLIAHRNAPKFNLKLEVEDAPSHSISRPGHGRDRPHPCDSTSYQSLILPLSKAMIRRKGGTVWRAWSAKIISKKLQRLLHREHCDNQCCNSGCCPVDAGCARQRSRDTTRALQLYGVIAPRHIQ